MHFSTEDKVFFGKVEGIPNLVSFEGSTVAELKLAFDEVVETTLAPGVNKLTNLKKNYYFYLKLAKMSTLQLQAYDMLKQKLGDKEAKLFIEYIEAKVEGQVEHGTKQLATKEDLLKGLAAVKEDLAKEITNIHRAVYAVSVIQFLAIVGSVNAIVTFMLHK